MKIALFFERCLTLLSLQKFPYDVLFLLISYWPQIAQISDFYNTNQLIYYKSETKLYFYHDKFEI